MLKDIENWYTSWFDSPYYHILYKNRDDKEAGLFMKNLTSFLKLSSSSTILDLACGKGRHSKYLNQLGYQVTGVDLSPQSIAYAKKFENENLFFDEHDMSKPYPKQFDAVFNLFTSFGYFEDEEDNLKTIKSIKSELNPKGFGVIDFLNSAGIPNQISFSGTSFVTNEYAPIIEFSPIVIPGIIVLCVPILQFFFKITLPFLSSIVE